MADLQLTRFTSGSPLTKRIYLRGDGTFASDSSRLILSTGKAGRLALSCMQDLADVLNSMPPTDALALGTLREGLPSPVEITMETQLRRRPGAVARSKKNLVYPKGAPGLVLLDHDAKGMPPHVRERLAGLGGFEAALESICPGILAAGSVMRVLKALAKASGDRITDLLLRHALGNELRSAGGEPSVAHFVVSVGVRDGVEAVAASILSAGKDRIVSRVCRSSYTAPPCACDRTNKLPSGRRRTFAV